MNVIYRNIKKKRLLFLLLFLALGNFSYAQVKLSADCTSGTANLSGITANNTPSGTSLTWHSGSTATTANKISSVSALSPGTYYAAFFDATYNCYSSSTFSVTITAALCLSNVCPATTVNLNTAISVSNLPGSTVLTWHTSLPATSLNKISDPTTIGVSGTYYAAFYDASNNCYSGDGDAATEVIVEISTCAPLAVENTCPVDSINLNTAFSVTNTPVGTTLTWHTGTPATTANEIAVPSAVKVSGTYYAAFYDATNNCYSTETTPVIATYTDCSTPLPIELLSFNAILNNRIVDLTWQTASEHNNDYFTVERSQEGYIFEPILYVDGAGTSNELLNYASKDLHPFDGVSYYRLKQTDFDGAFEYSEIRIVNMDENNSVIIYPNPTNSNVMYISSNTSLTSLSIYSADGKLVLEKEDVGNSFELNLVAGVYFANYIVDGKQFTKKIIFLNKV